MLDPKYLSSKHISDIVFLYKAAKCNKEIAERIRLALWICKMWKDGGCSLLITVVVGSIHKHWPRTYLSLPQTLWRLCNDKCTRIHALQHNSKKNKILHNLIMHLYICCLQPGSRCLGNAFITEPLWKTTNTTTDSPLLRNVCTVEQKKSRRMCCDHTKICFMFLAT